MPHTNKLQKKKSSMEVTRALEITTHRSSLGMTSDKPDSMVVNSKKNKLHNVKTETNILYLTSYQIQQTFQASSPRAKPHYVHFHHFISTTVNGKCQNNAALNEQIMDLSKFSLLVDKIHEKG